MRDSSVVTHSDSSHTDNGLTNWNPVSSKVYVSSTATASSADIKNFSGDINKQGVYADALNYKVNLARTSNFLLELLLFRIKNKN